MYGRSSLLRHKLMHSRETAYTSEVVGPSVRLLPGRVEIELCYSAMYEASWRQLRRVRLLALYAVLALIALVVLESWIDPRWILTRQLVISFSVWAVFWSYPVVRYQWWRCPRCRPPFSDRLPHRTVVNLAAGKVRQLWSTGRELGINSLGRGGRNRPSPASGDRTRTHSLQATS
jgi:hypothetical protein